MSSSRNESKWSLSRLLQSVTCSQCCHFDRNAQIVVCLMIVIGLGVGATVLAIGIPQQAQTQNDHFHMVANEAFLRFQSALDEYEVSGLWLHQSCHNRKMAFDYFYDIYQHIALVGLEFLGLSCGLNVSASERSYFENQSKAYLAKRFPDFDYRGFTGALYNRSTGDTRVGLLPNRSHYFVAHFVEPLQEPRDLMAVDFDMMSSQNYSRIIDQALSTGNLSVTERFIYLPPSPEPALPYEYSLIMAHPGLLASIVTGEKMYREIAILVLRFNALLEQAYRDFSVEEETWVYVFDSTSSVVRVEGQPAYMGGASLMQDAFEILPEINISSLYTPTANPKVDETIAFAGRQWTFVVTSPVDAYKPNYFLAIFGALMIVVASACAGLWIYARSRARTDKAAILLDCANKAAQTERELNDFIAHEVRNPLSAAISANEFVSLAVNETEPLITADARESVREDVVIIGNSMRYINDLLRSMLDVHRASSNQINIKPKHVSMRHDIFDPVASMLYHRGCDFDVLVDCSEELVVYSDPFRLKQVILNLAVNATKFVVKGFVRLRADVDQSVVRLYVEDSGPGIPQAKRDQLFGKFQPSLDTLNQGTGVGLSLCKHLVDLMQGSIHLDDSYDSGVPDYRGSCFVITLYGNPVHMESSGLLDDMVVSEDKGCEMGNCQGLNSSPELNSPQYAAGLALPDNLSILFVDDDCILRKLFNRSIKRCRPTWSVSEAASGEATLQLVDARGPGDSFHVIFIDQYMASAQKQLLGTETVRLLRSKGVSSVICGLSANDIGHQFLEAGANCFSLKPLPCDKDALIAELKRVLASPKWRVRCDASS